MYECPHCDAKFEIDFWEYYDKHNPFPCPQCGKDIHLIYEEYWDGENEDNYYYLSKSKQ